MVSVVRCWKAEYQKCKHSILLYMHSMIPIICAAIFAGYYHISRWELATKISAYLEVLAVAFPFLIGIIVGLVVQIENQAGHYQLLLGTIPSRMATYIGKLGFLMICAFGATFLALGTFAALYRDAPASLYLKAGILLLITMLSFKFGLGLSLFWGVFESLQCILYSNIELKGVARYIPFAWSMNWVQDILSRQIFNYGTEKIWIAALTTGGLLLTLLWFSHWEGRKNYE